MLKKVTRVFFIVLCSIILVFFVFIFSFGGFGKREQVIHLPFKKDSVLLFAHRGIFHYYAENSLEGIRQSGLRGFNAVEIDIRRSASNEFVVFHDEDCERLLGIKNKEITALTTAEIKKQPILLNDRKTNSYVSTAEEMLRNRDTNMVFYFDMKISTNKDADEIAKMIIENHATRQIIVANWDIVFIFYMEARYPEILTTLEGFNSGKEWMFYLMPKNLKPDFVSGLVEYTDRSHVEWLRENDMMDRKIIYGVNKTSIDSVLSFGYKNILIDYDSSMYSTTRMGEFLE